MIPTQIIKDFITEEERLVLNEWVTANHEQEYFQYSNMGRADTQWTTRYWGKQGEDQSLIQFPELVYELQERCKQQLGLNEGEYKLPPFKDGISAYYYVENAGISEHTDAIWYPMSFTVHCNIITQAAEAGGITKIDGEYWPTEQRDLLIYTVSKFPHRVNRVQGKTPRILWSWGFCPSTHRYDPVSNSYITL